MWSSLWSLWASIDWLALSSLATLLAALVALDGVRAAREIGAEAGRVALQIAQSEAAERKETLTAARKGNG
jgi:hypothetical protein